MYYSKYNSPLGEIEIITTEKALIYLNFSDGRYLKKIEENYKNEEILIIKETKNWLDVYFSGKEPIKLPNIILEGTEFQKQVWNELLKIPYGKTITYSEIANKIAKIRNLDKMSSRAVGSAVGKNPISIIVPCHRVIGKNGSLTGYGGGIFRKEALLKIEKIL